MVAEEGEKRRESQGGIHVVIMTKGRRRRRRSEQSHTSQGSIARGDTIGMIDHSLLHRHCHHMESIIPRSGGRISTTTTMDIAGMTMMTEEGKGRTLEAGASMDITVVMAAESTLVMTTTMTRGEEARRITAILPVKMIIMDRIVLEGDDTGVAIVTAGVGVAVQGGGTAIVDLVAGAGIGMTIDTRKELGENIMTTINPIISRVVPMVMMKNELTEDQITITSKNK